MQDHTVFDTIEIPVIYIEVFALMFISFLIGYLFAFYYQKSKCAHTTLDNTDYEDGDYSNPDYTEEEVEENDKIAVNNYSINVQDKKSIQGNKHLNFDRLSYANASIKDNLQRIVGIGPFTEQKLNDIGIYTYAQISNLKDQDIQIITELIRFFPDRIKNDKWTEQAKMLTSQKKSPRRDTMLKV
ncbi:MAG TPA: hypothetical protein ENH91_06475 [Leeuwenhoekiella sp.]|nr:hypothetical protein [Leeuwenhoekiella sp.]